MHTITLKSIPDDLYSQLKATAIRNKRSLNKEVLHMIEQNINQRKRDPQEILRGVREMRKRVKVSGITNEFIDSAIQEGRS